MKKNIILVLLLLMCINSLAQSVRIEGKIVDKTNNIPIPFASINIKNSSSGTMADENGCFSINVPEKYKTLEFSHTSYNKAIIGIDNIIRNKTIKLSPKIKELKEVTIEGFSPKTILFKAFKAVPNNYIKDKYYAEIEILNKKIDTNTLSFLSYNDGIYLCRGALSRHTVMKPKYCHAYYSDSTIKFKYNKIDPDFVISNYKNNKKDLEKNDMSIFDGLNIKMQTIYDDKGDEQDYIITTRSNKNELSNKSFRKDNFPIICNYHIDARTFAIKQVEIFQDTTIMDYMGKRGVKYNYLGLYQIYNYQKKDSVYVLANRLSKVKYKVNYYEPYYMLKKYSRLPGELKVNTIEEVYIFRVKNIAYKQDDLQLELEKDVYMPLNEMRKLELFSPLFLDNVKNSYE